MFWGTQSKENIDMLERIQRTAMQIIKGLKDKYALIQQERCTEAELAQAESLGRLEIHAFRPKAGA